MGGSLNVQVKVTTARTEKRVQREYPLWQAYTQRRYTILFYSLLLMLVAMPAGARLELPGVFLKLLLGACLVAAVMSNATKRTRWALLIMTLLLVIARMLSDESWFPPTSPGVLAVYGVIGLVAAGGALRFVVLADKVDRETLYAALSTYLLAGLFFGLLYWSIEQTWPGSMSGPDPLTEANAIYYSFVTLATLGYGDFLPKSEIARGLATFEVIGGQLYLAVMVARLIGVFGSGEKHE